MGTAQARFKFRHALVRDAAYSLLTEDNRVNSHRLACAHLEQSGGADPAVLAEHAYQGRVFELAARFCIEAGQRALSSFDLDAAERHAQRAIECGARDEQLGAVRAIQAWLATFRLDPLGGYTHALEALQILKPGSFWWTKTAAICFYAFFLLNRLEHAEHIIRTFLASEPEPDPDTRLAYLESGATLAIFFQVSGARRACNLLIGRLTQVVVDVDPKDRGYLVHATAWRALFLEPDQSQLGPAVLGAANKLLAELSMAAGDRETAEVAVRAALAGFMPMLPYRLQVVPTAVALALERGRVAEARQLAEEALVQLDEQGGLGAGDVPARLAVAQARLADGDRDGGRSALQSALEQLRLRASKIDDAGMRESYLALAHHRQLLDLARAHGMLPSTFTAGDGPGRPPDG